MKLGRINVINTRANARLTDSTAKWLMYVPVREVSSSNPGPTKSSLALQTGRSPSTSTKIWLCCLSGWCYVVEMGLAQWCSKTTKLQDQDHLFFQDQDHFFKNKTKTAFFKVHQIINLRLWPVMPELCR